MTIRYKIEFYTYWHCGSGLSAGADVDLLAIKDEEGFPFIPGKTVKGLIREATETLVKLNLDRYPSWDEVEKIFGQDNSLQGCAFFSNAELPDEDKAALKPYAKHLFTALSSTAIGNDGIAMEHSLRRIEVALPCVLTGEIMRWPDDEKGENENKPDDDKGKNENMKLIEDSLAFVKMLGENRNRGLGRCRFSIMSNDGNEKKEAGNENE